MARGRMITNEITKDKRINDLSDDTSRLAFTWLITFCDAEGRVYGDPALVLSMLFPRRRDISIKQMETYIQEWHNSGMVVWYEAGGDKFIYFPSFSKHQVGLRKDRETSSIIPPPPGLVPEPAPSNPPEPPQDSGKSDSPSPDELLSDSGVIPEEIGLIKENLKLREDRGEDAAPEPEKPTRKEIERMRAELVRVFLIKTGLTAPKTDKPHIKGTQKLWWSPVEDMLCEGGWQYGKVEEALAVAIKRMAGDGLTISDPNSILKTVRSVLAEKNRNGHEKHYSEVY